MKSNKLYQVSTLQALALGYTKPVVTAKEMIKNGDIGLGTFDTYSLKEASQSEIEEVEQENG